MSHQPLWAPWRMEFIDGAKDGRTSDCVFCTLPKKSEDRETLIVHRGKEAYVILNKYPYNNGHLMVVPNEHLADFGALKPTVLAEMMALAQRSMRALTSAYKPQGFNLGMNLGSAAGAGIKDHVHLHIVPRWVGDTNFMPVLGDVKSMPQHLEKSFEVLAAHMKEAK